MLDLLLERPVSSPRECRVFQFRLLLSLSVLLEPVPLELSSEFQRLEFHPFLASLFDKVNQNEEVQQLDSSWLDFSWLGTFWHIQELAYSRHECTSCHHTDVDSSHQSSRD